MTSDDLWYKQAVIYCLDVETFLDASGDGVGDFEGLRRKLEYLARLGVTCLWLQPFYPSPNRDNGYDVSDYYGVDSRLGNLGDYVDFINHAKSLGLRVLVDLVANHTSIEHPWFQSARSSRHSPHRSWYHWTDELPKNHAEGVVFPGLQTTNWTWDDAAGQYYFHRFFEFQPDLNTKHPAVRAELKKVMGFWLELGVSGFRVDAVPFLIEPTHGGAEQAYDFDLLHEMRDFLQWRRRDAILLAEANVLPQESDDYFGQQGDRLQMMLNFPVNQRLFLALATGNVQPLRWALEQTRKPHGCAQWVQFLRSHDELDLGRLTDSERRSVYAAFGPEEGMQLYGRGIRRRLAPMLKGDRKHIRLAFSLLMSLPGTPMIQYGDEIGIGDDLSLPDRQCARTPMQWSGERQAGFSLARTIVRPVVSNGDFSFHEINVAAQQRDRDSLLTWLEQLIRVRRELTTIGWGDYILLDSDVPMVLIMYYQWRGEALVILHHFGTAKVHVTFQLPDQVQTQTESASTLSDVFSNATFPFDDHRSVTVPLDRYGHLWLRVGNQDTSLTRSTY
jgi:maltose alpha-D-glucosyltransferase/alpha-amylase